MISLTDLEKSWILAETNRAKTDKIYHTSKLKAQTSNPILFIIYLSNTHHPIWL